MGLLSQGWVKTLGSSQSARSPMPLNHVIGVDHVVVTVHDLDQAAQQWAQAGFTLSPRGLHSAHIGTANYTNIAVRSFVAVCPAVQDERQDRIAGQQRSERVGLFDT
ncbi:MAG: VOC family protein [Elsteraceae bacterium]